MYISAFQKDILRLKDEGKDPKRIAAKLGVSSSLIGKNLKFLLNARKVNCPLIHRNAAKCLKCGDILESKFTHDFKQCSCEAIFIDGGHDYLRRGGDLQVFLDLSE